MSGYEQALLLLAGGGLVFAVWGLFAARRLAQLEREISDREAAEHPAE
jgi:hypothetical protein